jgi:hypothetical protein
MNICEKLTYAQYSHLNPDDMKWLAQKVLDFKNAPENQDKYKDGYLFIGIQDIRNRYKDEVTKKEQQIRERLDIKGTLLNTDLEKALIYMILTDQEVTSVGIGRGWDLYIGFGPEGKNQHPNVLRNFNNRDTLKEYL